MIDSLLSLFWVYGIYIIVLSVIGLYCILVTLSIVRTLIGIEVMMKAVTLLIVISGFTCGHTALSQALVVTLIVIETVFIAVAMGIVLGVYRHTKSLDTKNLTNLKG